MPYRYLVDVVNGKRQLNVVWSGAMRVHVWTFWRLILHQYCTVPRRPAGLRGDVGGGSWQLPSNEGSDDVWLRVVRHATDVDH